MYDFYSYFDDLEGSQNKKMISVNVGATFPDDFEDSPLKSEILQKRNPNPGVDESYHPVSISLDISIALRY